MPNRLSSVQGYVRMSWAPENLYNLARVSFGKPNELPIRIANMARLDRSRLTMFQQRWLSKRLLRAYHGDWIQERIFRRRFLPTALPPLQAPAATVTYDDKGKQVMREGDASTGRQARGQENQRIPLGSLMWRELEARLDVVVFRACFAHSVYEARRLVTQGHVKLNDQVVRDPGLLLAPGDIFRVDPQAMYLLRQHDKPFETQSIGTSENTDNAETEASTTTDATDSASASSTPPANETSETSPTASTSQASESSTKPEKKRGSSIPGQPFNLPDYAAPFLFIPAYLEVSFPACSGIYVRHPTARPGYSEIPSPYEADGDIARLTWEFYTGVGRRRKGVRDWEEEARDMERRRTAPTDRKDRRIWGADWPDKELEMRRMRGVRPGNGKWAHRPV